MKNCPKCNTAKPFAEFSKNKNRKDGHDIYCRLCKKDIDRATTILLREEGIRQYSASEQPCCAYCGEDFFEVLAIDHIDNNGSSDRKARGRGNSFYYSLKREGWPKGYQVLCISCNFLKHWYPERLDDFANRNI